MEKCKCLLLSERSQSKKATYCMIPIIWYSEKGKTLETVQITVVARGQGIERWVATLQRIWVGNETILYKSQRSTPVIIHLSKQLECTAPKGRPRVNHGLWVMVYHCRFTDWSKCTTVEQGCCACVRIGSMWELLALSLSVNPKLL